MNKYKLMFTLAGFVSVAALAITVQAAPPPKTCPGGYNRIPVKQAEDEQFARQVDQDGNHNKFVCEAQGGQQPPYVDDDE
jgi:hypothetical protein